MITIFVPETYHPVLLRNAARRLRKDTGERKWYAQIKKMDRSSEQIVICSYYRPLMFLALEPMCIHTSLSLGVLYLFFEAFTLVFANNHDFNLCQVGLSFLGMLVGMLCADATNPTWRKNYIRLVKKRESHGGEASRSEPEY